jgi:histidinol phosphatase-like enzyme (inositol monophosphatase family)
MTRPTPQDLLRTAFAAADAAGRAALARFRTAVPSETKSDGTIVTAADREAEEILRAAVLARHPDHAILGEEGGDTAGSAPWRWILDPIDGTESFARGVPLWAVLVGVEHEGDVVAGVVHFPALGETFAAARGHGATWNGAPCRVSTVADLSRAMLVATSDRSARRHLPGWPALVDRCARLRGWSDAYALACVAAGRADVVVEPVMRPWDNAPFLVLLEEAGGRFTDVTGKRTIHGGNALATNGLLHEAALAVLGASRPR